MDNIIVTITVILIIGIIAFLIFKKFIKSKLTIDKKLDNENSLPIELPWEVQSINSTDLALYRQSESLTLTDHLKSHIGDCHIPPPFFKLKFYSSTILLRLCNNFNK